MQAYPCGRIVITGVHRMRERYVSSASDVSPVTHETLERRPQDTGVLHEEGPAMSRISSASSRIRVAAGAAALIAVACTASAAAAGGSPGSDTPGGSREAAALTGSAKLSRTLGDDITFTFDAHLAAEHRMDPAKATGTFRFSHYLDGEGAWAKGRIDCLVTGGKVAVATGVITGSDLPGAKGKRV